MYTFVERYQPIKIVIEIREVSTKKIVERHSLDFKAGFSEHIRCVNYLAGMNEYRKKHFPFPEYKMSVESEETGNN